MPNMKELCKTLDRLDARLTAATSRLDQIEKMQQAGQYFAGGGQAQSPPEQQAPSPAGAPPAPPASPKQPQEAPGQDGPRSPGYMKNVFGSGGSAHESDRREGREEREKSRQTEADTIKQMMDEIFKEKYAYETEHIGMGGNSSLLSKKQGGFNLKDPTEDLQKMIDEKIKEAKEDLRKGNERSTKEYVGNSVFGLLSNVFGRRMINMLTPDKLHAGDLLYMAQNIKWIDGKVQDTISKSIAEKVASGQMTKAAAANAGGFMSGEALGAQLVGGALTGVFIAKHIPKMIEIFKDVSELQESVKAMLTGNRSSDGITLSLQKSSSWWNTLNASADKTDQMMGSRTILGMSAGKVDADVLRDKLQTIMSNDKFLDSTIKQYVSNAQDSTAFSSGFIRGFSKIWKFA